MKFEHIWDVFLFHQTDELYEEILCNILHNVGCETENETCQSALFSYIQDVFKVFTIILLFVFFFPFPILLTLSAFNANERGNENFISLLPF